MGGNGEGKRNGKIGKIGRIRYDLDQTDIGKTIQPVSYTGPDALKHFFLHLIKNISLRWKLVFGGFETRLKIIKFGHCSFSLQSAIERRQNHSHLLP